jgi:two-component system sensor histidine kinase/response regulator
MRTLASPQGGAKILVVDDDGENLELLGALLAEQGYQARLISSGKEALAGARQDPPDLILLDVNMPGMNGYELCERLRSEPILADIPVLFLSGAVQTADKIRAFQAGGMDYITRPFESEELSARVRTQLELRRQNRELQQSYERLRELEHLRDNLVHMIVHDLRSPIHGLQMFLSVISEQLLPGAPADQVHLLAQASVCVNRLSQMTSQLLDISRLEAGQMPLNSQQGNLARTVASVIDSIATLAQKTPRRMTLSGAATAFYDTDIVRRMVENLLINALKFSPADSEIKITITTEGDRALVTVSDSGPGIPAELQLKIFEKFAQVNPDHKHHGAGLGLAFCKLAAEAHGGQIGLISQPGQGSRFWFTLPIRSGRP